MSFFVFNEEHTRTLLKNLVILTKNGLDYNFLVNLPAHLFQTVIEINNKSEEENKEPEKIDEPKSIGQQFPGLFNK